MERGDRERQRLREHGLHNLGGGIERERERERRGIEKDKDREGERE